MPHAQVIEGTTEEIAELLQAGALAGRRLRLIIEPDEDDLSAEIPGPPHAVETAEQLEHLLRVGLASPVQEMTDETWDELKRRADARRIGQVY